MRVYSYCRVSAGHQTRGGGLDRQLDAAAAYANRIGAVLDTELSLVDAGRSAYRGKHLKGALGRFLALAQAGQLGPDPHLVCEDIDRLSRLEPLDGLSDVLLALIQAGVTVHTTIDDADYNRDRLNRDPSALLVLVVKAQAAHDYSKRLAARVADAHARKRVAIAGGAKVKIGVLPAWVDPDFTLNAHAATVARIFDLSARGYGGVRIARTLNEEGIRTFSGRTWSGNGVNSLMRRPAVYGALQHKGGLLEGFYPPAVTREQWLAAQHRRTQAAGRSGGFAQATAWHWVGQGLTTCHLCGSGAGVNSGSDRRGGRLFYLRCPRPGCAKGGWRLAEAQSYLIDRIAWPARAMLQAKPQDLGQIDHQLMQAEVALAAAEAAQGNAEAKVLAAVTADVSLATVELLGQATAAARAATEDARKHRDELAAQRVSQTATEPLPEGTPELGTPGERQEFNAALRRWGLRIEVDRAANRWGLGLPGRELVWAPFSPDWWLDFGWVGAPQDPS